jgi:hypothetical protein
MKDSLFFESPPLDVDSQGQSLGQRGRWFRQDSRIVVLLDDEAQPRGWRDPRTICGWRPFSKGFDRPKRG